MSSFRLFLNEYNLTDLRIPSIDLIDIIDILIVAFFIYNIIIWIKETRAWSLFKGVIVILFIAFIAILFNLNTILFILTNAISVGIIAIIVVFQPELRKALEELGRGNFFSSFLVSDNIGSEKLNENAIEELIKAIARMSHSKTGALILIEQAVPLGDHEKTGIPIDAFITSQLLLNIFEKNTPLHDGAVIIKNNRIAAAACFLPLTASTEINMELGTRHRAALGVSEVSDCYVLVVSEETGQISLVYNGNILRDMKLETVRKTLIKLMNPPKKKFFFRKDKVKQDEAE